MSIAAIIIEPPNRDFYVPIASEEFFHKCWVPIIQDLKLKLVPLFNPGIDLIKKELPTLLSELKQIKDYGLKTLTYNEQSHIITRIELLENKLSEVFSEEGIVVFIG
ncbi:hypothetical protein [Gorillibacterium sp. sgz5001074]|uniref:hypothetical protein n=1 Tax=Gorillibacterium sp. sgz5001074 TaxID=3446695 RepID=UPI003F673B74